MSAASSALCTRMRCRMHGRASYTPERFPLLSVGRSLTSLLCSLLCLSFYPAVCVGVFCPAEVRGILMSARSQAQVLLTDVGLMPCCVCAAAAAAVGVVCLCVLLCRAEVRSILMSARSQVKVPLSCCLPCCVAMR